MTPTGNIMGNTVGLYIHIPFCEKKCRYCGFLSFDGGSRGETEIYVDALLRELALAAPRDGTVTDTVFIGGGTPSILRFDDIENSMRTVRAEYDLAADAEITIESNPGSLTAEKLRAFRGAGINRLSIGVQSFDDDVLSTLGRIHRSADAAEAFRMARISGFDNINLDLMFGIPGQTDAQWDETLSEVLELAPEHISFYSLQLEPGTPFYEEYKNEKLELTDNETERRMYHRAVSALKDAGYIHYEISNASMPGRRCLHNLKYWNYDGYIGTGLGASSFFNGKRYRNTGDLESYIRFFSSGADSDPPRIPENEDARGEYGIYCFTALRTSEGISLSKFRDTFGISLYEAFPSSLASLGGYISKGYLDASGGTISLTEKGIDISNEIMAEFV